MNSDLALSSSSHDLMFSENNDLIIISGVEQVAQQIKCRLKFWLGEWFLDISKGVPYLDSILIKNANLQQIRSIFRTQISGIEGVSKVDSLTLSWDRKTRVLTVEYEVTTSYGLLVKKEVLEYV